jgi:hypothetical protein
MKTFFSFPFLLIYVLLLLGLLWHWQYKRLAQMVLLSLIIGIYLLSTPLMTRLLFELIGGQAQALSPQQVSQTKAQMIVVLGGGFYRGVEFNHQSHAAFRSLSRVHYAAYLAKKTQLPILKSVRITLFSLASYAQNRFFRAVNLSLTQDRPRFIGRWQRLRNLPNEQRQQAEQQLQQSLHQSQQQAQQRQQNVPALQLNEDLPVSQRANEIIEAIKNHQVVVLAGETGSGKTTQLPKLCLKAGRGVYGWIGHTQPRRLAARSVAARIAEEVNSPLGEVVGYKVRFNEAFKPEGYVKLMTDGILLAELANDRYLNAYDTLIIDEAHERSLNIDFLLGYLRQLLPKRPDLKVIITSATLRCRAF